MTQCPTAIPRPPRNRRRPGRRFGIAALSLAAGIGAAIAIGQAGGLRLNFTHSAPSGLWRVQRLDGATPARGALVEVCPPAQPIVQRMADRGLLAPGDCAGARALGALLKPVAAVAGDRVTLVPGRAIAVNGATLPNTQAVAAIPAWTSGSHTVMPGQVWLLSTYSALSFDSRYFGPVDIANVRGLARPVLVSGRAADMTLVTARPQP